MTYLIFGCVSLTADTGLTIWDFKYTDSKTKIAINRIDNLFKVDNNGIELIHKGFFDQEYIPALRSALLAGTGPDIMWLHMGPELTENQQYLEPLDHFINSTDISLKKSSLDYFRKEMGTLKVLPLTFQGFGWYYNKELFIKAGLDPEKPPANWDDFLETCEALKKNGINPIATGNNRPITTEFLRRSLISAFFTEDEIQRFYHQGQGFTTNRFRTLMEMIIEIRENNFFDNNGIYKPYFNYASNSFSDSNSAMILGLISDTSHWKTFTDSLGSGNVGYFPNLIHPLMKRPGIQLIQPAGVLVGINRTSKNKEAAYKYLEHLFSQKSQKILTQDLGMLIPLNDSILPLNEYPVLKEIYNTLNYSGTDPEVFVPSHYITELQYRLDDLLFNSREINLDDYLKKIHEELLLY
ncbi:MAG: extracellular solute-binding protein [Spirochaetaceae bacterium]